MKSTFLFLILITFVITSCTPSSNNVYVDPECEARALALVPEEITLNFESAFNGPNDIELPYVLYSVTWKNGFSSNTDRAFRIPTAPGLDRNYYYSLERETEVDEAWLHTDPIKYQPIDNSAYYIYDFVLQSTSEISYARKENRLSGLPEDDMTKGTRVFKIVEAEVITCGDNK